MVSHDLLMSVVIITKRPSPSCVSVAFSGVNDAGINYGTVDYWIRLRVPMEQALRLYKVDFFSVVLGVFTF